MIIPRAQLEEMAAGRITCAFRRWRRPTVKAGGTLRTALGVLAIDAVETLEESGLTATDARAAGYCSIEELREALALAPAGQVYRIRLHWHGADPRVALRERAALDGTETDRIRARLAGFDARSDHGPWTTAVLRAIGADAGLPAAQLAARLGFEKLWLKARIRRLKELGLTESLEVGYRLSPRGSALLPTLR